MKEYWVVVIDHTNAPVFRYEKKAPLELPKAPKSNRNDTYFVASVAYLIR